MPIEIKELHIRVSVNTSPGAPAQTGQSTAAGSNNSSSDGDDEKEALVAACVEQVMQILQNRMER